MSEKTKQSSLSCTCKEMVWFVNFWSRDWEGRRPWMTSLRKVEENGRMVRRRTRETTQLRKRRVVFPAPATSTLTAHTAQQLCSEFHQRRNLEFLFFFPKWIFFLRSTADTREEKQHVCWRGLGCLSRKNRFSKVIKGKTKIITNTALLTS